MKQSMVHCSRDQSEGKLSRFESQLSTCCLVTQTTLGYSLPHFLVYEVEMSLLSSACCGGYIQQSCKALNAMTLSAGWLLALLCIIIHMLSPVLLRSWCPKYKYCAYKSPSWEQLLRTGTHGPLWRMSCRLCDYSSHAPCCPEQFELLWLTGLMSLCLSASFPWISS